MRGDPILVWILKISNFAPCGLFGACETIFRIYRISGIHFCYRQGGGGGIEKSMFLKKKKSNFASCGPSGACETIFCMYKISGIYF